MNKSNFETKLNLIKKFSILSLLSLIIFFSLELFAKKDTGFIEWRAISAANGYRVEIKSDNKVIIETNVTENIYYVDLPKGKYEFRIGVLNFFKKPVVWSYWNPLRVIVSREPLLEGEGIDVSLGDKALLSGENFLENTKINLVNEGKIIPVESLILNDKRITFPTEKLKLGTYDVILENPNNKKTIRKKYVVIYEPSQKPASRKPPEKVIKRNDIEISSESIEKADITVDESVAGKTTVNIGPKSKEKLDITLENKSKEKVAVDINNRAEGKVNFNVENKSRELIALNVNNQSKESIAIGIVDKSKGKVDVIVNEKSKSKVDINNVVANIDKFDVTIENKAKERFDINIGKEPEKFIQPKRTPDKTITKNGVTISSDSIYRADINVEENSFGKTSVNIGPNTKEDLEINLENKSKENVTVDINNRSEGKITFNVENKSSENLALNINNASKEKFSLGINEKSKGKVDVKVDEKSKSKVDINNVNTNIETFDVTIENQTRNNFDIHIGKKEIPPPVFKTSQEKFPKDYYKFTLKEYQNFVNNLSRSCVSNLDVPDILIDKCHPKHVSLNLGDQDRKILYNFIKLESGNYISRISSYKFYIENCNPSLNFVIELLDFRIKNITQDENENFYAKKTITNFNTCKNKDEQ